MRMLLALIVLLMSVAWGADANVTGTWAFEVTTTAGSGTPSFEFKQDGTKLTGKYTGMAGEAPLTGTVTGNKIQFEFKISLGGDAGVVRYSGTIESATTMKGTAVYPELGEASWTASKK